MSFDPALNKPPTPAEFGEATPQTCLCVARAAATLAATADDAALDAFCRSSTRSMARLEAVMHATHREAVEAERYAALAEEWDADPGMPARRPSTVDLGMPTFADVAIRTTTTSTDQHRP
ncbi:hypothetical protein ACGFR6_17175 [Streptomyces sp. NPDC048567]|uniref:hypothetical protein n=1 Tax=Streptomyces sp. NPDC048567 TaxID=3365570 RepID=UPI003719CB88